MVEPSIRMYLDNVVTACTYSELKPGLSRVAVCLQNVIFRPITLPARTSIGTLCAVNISPLVLAPREKTPVECWTIAVQGFSRNPVAVLER